VALVTPVGFFLCTAAYLALFLWIGGYRRPLAVAAMSVLGSLTLMFIFMKLVYVSLPIGQPPFSEVMLGLMQLMGIR
jgi:putative tricarboxylic transport membrane protein